MKLSNKWYLVCDGKSSYVTNNIDEAKTLNVVIIKITPNEAATILALSKSNRQD